LKVVQTFSDKESKALLQYGEIIAEKNKKLMGQVKPLFSTQEYWKCRHKQ